MVALATSRTYLMIYWIDITHIDIWPNVQRGSYNVWEIYKGVCPRFWIWLQQYNFLVCDLTYFEFDSIT